MSHLAHYVFFSAVLSVTADFICWESMYKTSPFAQGCAALHGFGGTIQGRT